MFQNGDFLVWLHKTISYVHHGDPYSVYMYICVCTVCIFTHVHTVCAVCVYMNVHQYIVCIDVHTVQRV